MIPMTLEAVAAAVGGRLTAGTDPKAVVTGGVVTDTRRLHAGDLFVAIVGERIDAHDLVGEAVQAGAVAALVTREVAGPAVLVDAVEPALSRLARAVTDALDELVVVGVTGSAGKTSTKDLLADVLLPLGEVVAPEGSFNNEIGLPVTALRCTPATRVLVAEMGARGVGHIAALCASTPPDVGLVLNVGSAHLGEFGSQAAIAQAKGELVEALRPGGTAVLNADDPLVAGMAGRAADGVRVWRFGESDAADVRALDVTVDDAGRAAFRLVLGAGALPEDTARVQLQLLGAHQVSNALAAAAVGVLLGVPLSVVAERLSQARPRSRWRMEVTERGDGVTVVNDAYNANPESMRAALKTLADLGRGRRTWAVLGEMLELGPASAEEHDAVGRLAVRLDVNRLVAVGEGARPMQLGAAHEGSWGDEATWVPDVAAAVALLLAEVAPGDVVLVKASRSIGLERVADALLDPGAAAWR
jgi:UDP-N-acetylmuramoyl-tripeptide--D-alanyl-D-alanine ligase